MKTENLGLMTGNLKSIYHAGNFNACLQESLNNFNSFIGMQSLVIEIVIKILSDHHRYLTKKSINTICNFRDTYKHKDSFAESIGNVIEKISGTFSVNTKEFEQAVSSYKQPFLPEGIESIHGQSCFPAAGAIDGAVYMLKILDTNRSVASSYGTPGHSGNHLLDITGSSLFSYLNQNQKNSSGQIHKLSMPVSLPLIWNPSRYTFIIEDSFKKEVNNVTGNSMGVAMLISLASLVSGQPLPVDIASSAGINRDGEILPVQSIRKKLAAIKTERDYITKIIISDRQVLPDDSPEFEYIRVGMVSDVIQTVFATSSNSVPFKVSGSHVLIDLKNGIDSMERQYRDYMVDTCMENCRLLIDYIESSINAESERRGTKPGKTKGTDIRLKYLFRCYWKLGACYCHKGNITESEKYLKKAGDIYKENRSIIEPRDYYNSRNNYAVLLKDIFCYEKAEKLHLKIEQELRAKGLTPKYISENSSSLSQLYLAQQRYKDAATRQKEAIKWIATDELHRNYGYLAQIYARMGAFDKAKNSLEQAQNRIDNIQDLSTKKIQLGYFHWIESEYLYRKFMFLKRNSSRYYEKLNLLSKEYENITHFSHGLINKFWGLAMLYFEESERGLEVLHKAQDYFDSQLDPMMALLGATVRIEKLSAWCKLKSSLNQEMISEQIIEEIEKIINALSVQTNIREFFHKDIKILQKSLSCRRESVRDCYPASGTISEAWQPVLEILQSINHRIPY